jgi:hypothetical protein
VDLWKFLSLLEQESLWFSRLDALGDPYEGLPPKPLVDDMWTVANALPEPERSRRREVASHNARVLEMGRQVLCVSCWHVNLVESAAMWKLYAPLGQAIAIRTTLENFIRSFTADAPDVCGGMVRYVDFESYRPPSLNPFDWATLKRTSFEHEHEFRAIVMPLMWPVPPGLGVPVDVNALISCVYVSPEAAPWYVDLVRRLCARYNLKAEVCQSELLNHPLYMRPRSDREDSA